jgi:hypothetical protein
LKELIAAIFRVKIISEIGTTLAITSNCSTLRRINHHMRKEAIEWDVAHDGQGRELLVAVSIRYRGDEV